jgi:hypothetical protein
MMSPVSDDDLLARQAALQDEARQVLAGLDLARLVADADPMLVTGSFVSGLMCWRELDVMVHAGSDFSPADVMGLLARMRSCASASPLSSASRCCASRTTGTASLLIRTVSVASTSTPPCSMTESVPWTTSRPGWPSTGEP